MEKVKKRSAVEEVQARIKEQMGLSMEKNQLKPGDPGYDPYPREDNDNFNNDEYRNQSPINTQQPIIPPTENKLSETANGQMPPTMVPNQQSTVPLIVQTNSTPVSQPFPFHLTQDEDVYQNMKVATNHQRVFNNFISEADRSQKNNLKYYDNLEIQRIQNELNFKQPIPITDNVSVKVDFPLHELPIEFQEFLESLSSSLNVPVMALISGFLASIYIAARGRFKIEVKKNYSEAFTEYFIVVMQSGSRKSAIVQSYKTVFDKKIEKIQAEYDKKAPNQKLVMQIYKKTERKILRDLTKGVTVDTISEIDLQIERLEEAISPLKKKLNEISSRPNLFNDFPTMKKLAENMKQQNEVIAIFDAEAGLWKSRVRTREDIILLKSYTGEPFGNETSTNGSVSMKAPCLTICSYIQPGVAFNLYAKEDLKDDGLLPRILPLFCLHGPIIWNPIPPDVPPQLMRIYEKKITTIIEYCSTENNKCNERLIETLCLSEGARNEYFNFSNKMINIETKKKIKDCEAFASKLAGHAIRLAGAVHFLQHDKPWEKVIDSSAMKAGIALAEFYMEHAIYAFDKEQNDSIVFAQKILKWVKRHRIVKFGQRDAQRCVGHCKINQIEAGIGLLQKNKYLAQHINYKNEMIYITNPNTFREED